MDSTAPRPTSGSQDLDPAWPLRALDDLSPTPFWLDSPAAPAVEPPLPSSETCDLAVVGAGYTGLWTALLAKERDPAREVVVVEAGRVARQASGRNGGSAWPHSRTASRTTSRAGPTTLCASPRPASRTSRR